VKLDPDHAEVMHTDRYFVFPVPGGLQGAVREHPDVVWVRGSGAEGGASSLDFDYRVVARRKDIPGPRLKKVTLPELGKELVRPPEPPEPPKAPAGPEWPVR